MNKIISVFALFLLISCSQHEQNSIKLGVDQTIKIPVDYVSVSADIRLEDTDASDVEKNGYKKLTQAVKLLKKMGYHKDQLEINSGKVRNRSYRDKKSYQYASSIKFDIKKLDQIDSIRRALLKKGINSFDISSYKNSNEDSLYDRAYRQAIQKAKQKAQHLLKSQDVKIGKILNLSENVKQTVVFSANQSKSPPNLNLDSALPEPPRAPLFHKKYYKKTIRFTITFALN